MKHVSGLTKHLHTLLQTYEMLHVIPAANALIMKKISRKSSNGDQMISVHAERYSMFVDHPCGCLAVRV